MAADRQRQALQTIYSFFLGLMVLALIGIAVYTVYPNPEVETSRKTERLYRDLEPYQTKTPSQLSAADRAKRDAIQAQLDAAQASERITMETWARNTSIAIIILATIVMVVSLVRPEELRVLSNGLLLGGVFTMLYGVGWSIASGESWTRLIVVLFATAVTIGLGYVKFVRMKKPGAASAEPTAEGVDVSTLEARVAAIETRLDAAAGALTREGH